MGNFAGGFQEQIKHLGGRGDRADLQIEIQSRPVIGHGVIDDPLAGHDVVGKDDDVGRPVQKPRLPPVRVHHHTLVGAEADPVAFFKRPGEVERHPGQDVTEHALEGQADDGRQDGRSRQKAGDIHVEHVLQNQEKDDKVKNPENQPAQDVGQRVRFLSIVIPGQHRPVDQANHEDDDEEKLGRFQVRSHRRRDAEHRLGRKKRSEGDQGNDQTGEKDQPALFLCSGKPVERRTDQGREKDDDRGNAEGDSQILIEVGHGGHLPE